MPNYLVSIHCNVNVEAETAQQAQDKVFAGINVPGMRYAMINPELDPYLNNPKEIDDKNFVTYEDDLRVNYACGCSVSKKDNADQFDDHICDNHLKVVANN